MLILNPELVKFGGAVWGDVSSVAVERSGERIVVNYGDLGPHVVLADVPEQRVTVKVTRALGSDELTALRPGDSAELVICVGPSGNAGPMRRRIRATAVVTGASYTVIAGKGAVQTVVLVCISATGAVDPVVVEDASDGVV